MLKTMKIYENVNKILFLSKLMFAGLFLEEDEYL